jgi:hypothetical protein
MEERTVLGMYMFKNAEYANRAITAIGAYERALAQGMTPAEATRMALKVEVRTQFAISQSDAPVVFSTPWSRTIFQFKSFWQKQLEYMTGLTRKDTQGRFDSRGKEMGRFVTMVAATSGLVGIPGAEAFDAVLKAATGYSPLESLRGAERSDEKSDIERAVSRFALRGAPGLADVDITRNVGFGDWLSPQSLLNPTGPLIPEVSLAVQAAAANPGRERDELLERLARRTWPEARRVHDALLSPASKRGEIVDSAGRVMVDKITPEERTKMVLGLTPTRLSEEREAFTKDVQSKAKYDSMQQGYIDQIVELRRAGKPKEAQLVIQKARAAGFPDVARGAALRQRQMRLPRIEQLHRGSRKTFRRIEQQEKQKLDFGVMAQEPPPER